MGMERKRLPLWLKIAYTVFMLVWVPTYVWHHGPQNFLWLCDICNLILLIAVWTESRLLFSSQLLAVFIPSVLWTFDVAWRFAFGVHPIGGTQYMFDSAIPLHIRLLSLFHIVVPPLLLWCVWRLGFDRRGLALQSALTAVLLPVTYLLTDPALNINWVHGLFGEQQSVVHPWLYVAFCIVSYPLALYLPTHGLGLLLFRRRPGGE
jgi:hypothetical protein